MDSLIPESPARLRGPSGGRERKEEERVQTQPREGPCGWAGGLELSRVRVPAAETLQAQAPVSQADAGPRPVVLQSGEEDGPQWV